jgi:hypothetical protein
MCISLRSSWLLGVARSKRTRRTHSVGWFEQGGWDPSGLELEDMLVGFYIISINGQRKFQPEFWEDEEKEW